MAYLILHSFNKYYNGCQSETMDASQKQWMPVRNNGCQSETMPQNKCSRKKLKNRHLVVDQNNRTTINH